MQLSLERVTLEERGFGVPVRHCGICRPSGDWFWSEPVEGLSWLSQWELRTHWCHIFLPLSPPCPPLLPYYFPGNFNFLSEIFSILLPTNSSVLWGNTWRQRLPDSHPHRTEERMQGSPVIHREREPANCVPLGNFLVSSFLLAALFPLIKFLGPRTSSVLLAFHSHAECWWNGKRTFAWICQQGKTWLTLLDPGMGFPICGGRHRSDLLTAHIHQWLWIQGRARGQMHHLWNSTPVRNNERYLSMGTTT